MGNDETDYSSELDSFFSNNAPPEAPTRKGESASEWAARLELESITLKSVFQKEISEAISSFSQQTDRALSTLHKKIDRIERAMEYNSSTVQELSKRRDKQNNPKLSQDIDRLVTQVAHHCKKTEKSVSQLEDSIPEHLADIKEFLRLLLPRVVHLEKMVDALQTKRMSQTFKNQENVKSPGWVQDDQGRSPEWVHDDPGRSPEWVYDDPEHYDEPVNNDSPTAHHSTDSLLSGTPFLPSQSNDEYYYSPSTQKRRRM